MAVQLEMCIVKYLFTKAFETVSTCVVLYFDVVIIFNGKLPYLTFLCIIYIGMRYVVYEVIAYSYAHRKDNAVWIKVYPAEDSAIFSRQDV